MGRQMYPQKDFDDTKVHVMALTVQEKKEHGSVEHMELEAVSRHGPRHGLLVQGPGLK